VPSNPPSTLDLFGWAFSFNPMNNEAPPTQNLLDSLPDPRQSYTYGGLPKQGGGRHEPCFAQAISGNRS